MTKVILVTVILAAIIYIVRFYRLKANLRGAMKQLENIGQNPEENRILLISFPDKDAESFLEAMNAYILLTRKKRIFYITREKELRTQIENISHDLRTPLTAIIGYMELLDMEKMSAEDREMIGNIMKKAKSLQGLIGNFYDLSRLEVGDYRLSMEKLDIIRFARETCLLFYQEFEKRRLQVEFAMEGKLVALADIGAMERIFNNMLQNSLRYAKSYLKICAYREEGKVVLCFENDAAEMKEEEAAHLFERFYVTEKARTSQSTGLGLTINKLLAEAMGGSVTARLQDKTLRVIYRFQSDECENKNEKIADCG